jgi:hypothetical protein
VNTFLPRNQYAPRLSAIGREYLVVWTSIWQDGSREGVYGQFVHEDGSLVGGEFRVNTTIVSEQMQPTVTSDGANQFLVIWTSYTGQPNSFDLFAQRYINVEGLLLPISTVYVWAPFALSNNVYQPQLCVSWPALLGISVSNYEVYVDGSTNAAAHATSNFWMMTAANGLKTNSTHSFAVDYVTTGARRSPLSPSASGTTWSGLNWGGIPYEWMGSYYGGYSKGTYHTNYWPAANLPVAAGGPSVLQVFVSGGNPFDSSTWLQSSLVNTPQGLFLSWNTMPGHTYQVMVTTNFTSWSVVPNAAARLATGTSDSMFVGGTPAGYYRVWFLY